MDYSDNEASASFAVYDLGEPSIVKPIDGLSNANNSIDFLFVDNGYYLDLNLTYFIEIDTSLNFTNPLINSGSFSPVMDYWNGNLQIYQRVFIFGEQEFIMVKIQVRGVKPEHLK